MKLARCVYVSRTRADLPLWQSTAEIVGAAQTRNSRDELTGALLAHGGWFVQCLEGQSRRLTKLLLQIGSDPRHTEMQLIEFIPTDTRRFPGWSMEHVTFDARLEAEIGPDFDPRTWDARDLISLLARSRRAAA